MIAYHNISKVHHIRNKVPSNYPSRRKFSRFISSQIKSAGAITSTPHAHLFWHERAAFQRLAFRRLTAGNAVVTTIIISLFFPPPLFPVSSVATFSHRRSARIKKLI